MGLQVSLLTFTLVAPIGALAASIQTDLFIYNNGDTVTVTGVDYGPSETVDIVTTDPAGSEVDRGTAETDDAGAFTYSFTLRATLAGLYDVVATGQVSGLSSSTQFDPPPPVPDNLRFSDARNTTGGIVLTWDRVTASTDCYELYRSTSPLPARPGSTGNFVCGSPPTPTANLRATIAQPSSGPVSFTDNTAVAGTTYYYYVTAQKEGNNQGESANSNQVATPSLNTSPTGFNFGNQSVGVASGAQTFTVTNNGLAATTFRSITKSGANQADFAVTGAPAAGTNFGIGASFTFSVTFTPGAIGARAATLSVNASDPAHSPASNFNSRLIGVSGTGTNANNAPVAQNGSLTTTEDTTGSGMLVATDADGNPLTYSIVVNGGHGTATVTNASTGAYTYAPALNYCGTDSFTFKANDGTADSNVATISVTVTCVNDPPDAVDDSLTVNEDSGTTSVSVLANDTDPDSDTLAVTAAGPASHGTVGFTATTATYRPDLNYCGSDSFPYSIADGHGGTDTATVSVTVTCVNDAPVAQNGTLTTNEDTAGTGTLVATDADGNPLTYSIVVNGGHGTATVTNASTGAYSYVPAANYCGPDSFTFKANDGTVDSNVATVSVTVTCVNDAPVAQNGSLTTNEDTTGTGTLVATDADGNPLTYSIVANGGHGTATVTNASTGAYSYVPAANYCGPDSFTFKANDLTVDSNVATVNVTVTCVNDAPVAHDDAATVLEDSTGNVISVLGNDTDVEGDTLTVTSVQNSTNGTATLHLDGSVTFNPATNVCAPDAGEFDYTVSDSHGGSDVGHVVVTITCVNDAPTADNQSVSPTEDDVDFAITLTGSTGPSNESAQTLTFILDTMPTHGALSETALGSVVTGGSLPLTLADAGVFYTPAANYCGPDSFTFHVKDNGGIADGGHDTSGTATVSINVQCVNDAPVVSITSGPHTVSENKSPSATVTFGFTITDVDSSSFTVVGGYPLCDTLGPVATNVQLTGSTGTFDCTFPDGPADPRLWIQVADDASATSNIATFDVHVYNVAPTVTFTSGDATVNESSVTLHTYTFTVSDPGDDTVIGNGTTCGIGGIQDAPTTPAIPPPAPLTTTFSFDCRFDDGPKDPDVQANATDSDTATGPFTTFDVHVDNVDPTADLGNTGPVAEGSPATISFTNQFDPSSADTSAGFHYAFACDGGSLGSATYGSGSGTSASTTCTFNDNGSFTVRARIIDKDGGFNEYTTPVTVNNVDPTATIVNTGPVAEGSPVGVRLTNAFDPSSADTTAGFHYAFACDGGSLAGATYGSGSGTGAGTSCTFDDGPSTHTVRARIIDKDGGFTEYTTTITVNNVNPTATLANNGPINEGSSATVSFGNQFDPSSADTTAGFHFAFACDGGSLGSATYAGSGTTSSTSCAFNDNGSFTVRARIIDKDGGFNEYTTVVTVDNVDPTADLGNNGPVNEGSPATISFTNQFDPSSADTSAGFHYAFACDGGSLGSATYGSGSGTSASTTCTFNDNGSFTVRARIIDKDGGFNEYTTPVTVNNVDPTATIVNTGPVAEGSPVGVRLTNAFDPSSADTTAGFHYAFACDGGSLAGATYGSGSGTGAGTSCTFDDGPSTHTVRARIIDKDGGFTEYTTTITVNNVNPTATLANNGPINEGSSATVSFGNQFDPSSADTTAGFHYAFACDGGSLGSATYAGSGTTSSTSCAFNDNGSFTVRARIIDKDGGFNEYTTVVTVDNVDPTATIVNTGPVAEGSPVGVRLTNPSDPSSADTSAGFKYSFACDGLTASLAATYAAAATAQGTSCTFGDNGTYTVVGRIFDKDGGSNDYSTTITVTNVAPTLNTPVFTFNPFTGVASASIKYSDPGWLDTHTATFVWGDGMLTTVNPDTSEHVQPDATGMFMSGHTYALGCVANQPKVVVTDDDGGSVTFTYTLTVDTYTVAFQAPIQDGVRNIVKQGNVIPVKLQITNCSGQAVLGKTLSIGYIQGDVYDDADNGALQLVESVSNADTSGFMRQVDGKYMYNLATKSLSPNMPYTVVVREPSTNQFVASFVIQSKK